MKLAKVRSNSKERGAQVMKPKKWTVRGCLGRRITYYRIHEWDSQREADGGVNDNRRGRKKLGQNQEAIERQNQGYPNISSNGPTGVQLLQMSRKIKRRKWKLKLQEVKQPVYES